MLENQSRETMSSWFVHRYNLQIYDSENVCYVNANLRSQKFLREQILLCIKCNINEMCGLSNQTGSGGNVVVNDIVLLVHIIATNSLFMMYVAYMLWPTPDRLLLICVQVSRENPQDAFRFGVMLPCTLHALHARQSHTVSGLWARWFRLVAVEYHSVHVHGVSAPWFCVIVVRIYPGH